MVSGSTFRALSSDAKKAHGMSPSVIILDELAQWGHGVGRDLYTALTTATGARAEPLTLVISTQTADDHALMSQLVELGKQVNAGTVVDPTFSAHIFEVPLDADPWDETVWPLANPALGDFRSLEEMRIFATRAASMPTDAAVFRLYYLNQRVQAEARWIPLDAWDACQAPLRPERRRCWLGVDLSTRSDLTAVALLWPDADGGLDVQVEFWCPRESIAARSQRDRVPYPRWAETGALTATEGNVVDYSVVEARLHALMTQYDVQEIAVDPWNARDVTARLLRDGLPAVTVAQTMANLTSASKTFERLILSRQLRHDGHPILRWCVGNAVAAMDGAGNVKPDKERSTEKIDGVSAVVTALALAMVATSGSVYDGRGLVIV